MDNGSAPDAPNQTTASLTANWTYAPIVTICTGTATVLLNGLVLIVLLRRENAAVPFTVYLINLMLANILFVILGNPLDIVNSVYSTWYLGWAVCTLYLYAYYVVACAVVSAQALITINRLWATSFPVHYRIHHSRRGAVLICLSMWLYVHICLGAGVLLDAVSYRLPVETNGCAINIQAPPLRSWGLITQWTNFNIPILLGAVAYFYIYTKVKKRWAIRRLTMKLVAPAPGKVTPVLTLSNPPSDSAVRESLASRKRSQSFFILTLVTWTNFVTLVPSQAYFTAVYYADPMTPAMDTLLRVSSIMLSLQAALNPVLFAISMDNVKRFLRDLLRDYCGCCY
ncbi:alpha-2B adrenergic receptor-like [Paramacrobiotus metropolitanus]|uniref:alpha-2B adrenergic receptor-like n=1 Tax=Paramacrobiotus metropolitanus TaxID=2943436 RepID=UPI002445C26B|nr:alpha-2B adrenergic receptor-like [Paramacrobiotus metropolitanus]